MKNILRLLFVIVFITLLGACGGGGDGIDIDFKSILDTETGEVLSLGDSPERFYEVLGEPSYVMDEGNSSILYFYDEYTLTVLFSDKGAIIISYVTESSTRFAFRNMLFNMTEVDEADIFENTYIHDSFYDESGNEIIDGEGVLEDTKYFVSLHVNADTGEVDFLLIHSADWEP